MKIGQRLDLIDEALDFDSHCGKRVIIIKGVIEMHKLLEGVYPEDAEIVLSRPLAKSFKSLQRQEEN